MIPNDREADVTTLAGWIAETTADVRSRVPKTFMRGSDASLVPFDGAALLLMLDVIEVVENRERMRDMWAGDDESGWPSLADWESSTVDVRDALNALSALVTT